MKPFHVVSILLTLVLATSGLVHSQEALTFESPLRPGDVVRVSVWPDTSLGGEFPVESDGQVYLPFLGNVQASGVSIVELRKRIREGFQSAQRNAVVTVTPLYRIGVTGAVQRPGLYLMPPTDGFFDVIATAGGFGIRADQSEVVVVRDGQVWSLNAKEAIEKGDLLPIEALALKSGDQIMVPFAPQPWGPRDWISLANLAISIILLADRLQD